MKAALFDLDGVIVDTEGTYTKFWAAIGQEYGCAPSFAYDIKGTNLTDILNRFDSERVREAIKYKIHDFEHTMEYPIFPCVLEFLNELRAAGFKTALYTSSDNIKMSYLERQHPTLLSLFDAVVTGSMVVNSKPDPEGYLKAAEMVGCDIRNCYVFEDSYQGVEAGLRSGATVIALATTNPAGKLKEKAHEVIDDFTGFNVDKMISISKL